MVETFGTEKVAHEIIIEAVRQNFDLTSIRFWRDAEPSSAYSQADAAYGHFGREEFPWGSD
ncbi:methionine adenosyltransferase domain-containing protein [Vibrio chagasii]|nr:methionine adenosyltransferase domain-containing protein [Vibrio chagasii]